METEKFSEHMSVFVQVAQARSFSAVARGMGMAASSVSRQIDALEAELGICLFTRSTRALVLTDAGELLFERAVKILQDMADARDELISMERNVTGVLRVSCLPAFGRRHVVPHLSSLFEQYPKLCVELELTERIVDPVVDRVDAVLRVGQQPDSSLISQTIASQRYVICASPDYLLRHGTPATVQELNHHRLIDRGHRTSMRGWRELFSKDQVCEQAFAFQCNDCDSRRQAVLQGLGIGLVPDWSIGEDIGAGRVVELQLDDLIPQPETGIYLLRALPRASLKLRAFSDHLIRHIGSPPIWQQAMARVRPHPPAGSDPARGLIPSIHAEA